MAFGNIFQEYHGNRHAKIGKISSNLQLIWIIGTMVLTMSFVGNLKAILTKKEFESKTQTIDEIIGKDLRVLLPDFTAAILEMHSFKDNVYERLLHQAVKTGGIYKLG